MINNKRIRTLALGALALLAIMFGLIYLLDMPVEHVLQLLVVSVVLVFILAVAGFFFALVVHLLKRLFSKK